VRVRGDHYPHPHFRPSYLDIDEISRSIGSWLMVINPRPG